MKSIFIVVPGIPKAQPRARMTRSGHVYTPNSAKSYKKDIQEEVLGHELFPILPIDCPIVCNIVFYMPRPKRLQRKCDPEQPIPHTSRPDKDNMEKAVMDALTDCGLWRDDSLVFSGHTAKYYTEKNGKPRTEIWINWNQEIH